MSTNTASSRRGGRRPGTRALSAWLALLALSAGCATQHPLRDEGVALLEAGQYKAGLGKLEQALARAPQDAQLRAELRTQREAVATRLAQAAQGALAAGRLDEAETLFLRLQQLQPGLDRAAAGLAAVARERRHAQALGRAQEALKRGATPEAEAQLRPLLAENPRHGAARALLRQIEEARQKESLTAPALRTRLAKPVDVQFRDASVRMVFEALSRSSGVNFVFDKDVRPDARTTIFARQVTVEDAIDLILLTNQLEKKVLSDNMLLVYPAVPAKQREYQELVIKTFYLENADPKQTLNAVKTLLKTKDVFIDEKLNLLVMRDTPDAIRLAEKLVAAHDLAEPEVLLEVEVIEITHARLTELGVKWPDTLSFGLTDASGGVFTVQDLRGINAGRISMTSPSITLNARSVDGDSNILASPRIRVRNREKARILIGDRVPVVSSQVTPSTGTPVITENVQYLDVGLKLEVEPEVHLDEDVAIKVSLEVSTLGEQLRTATGTVAYRVGTRNATTVLRLRDGETQVLMGLIRNDERKAANKLPGLGELPVLGRLFGSHQNERQKTEIVLSITPRVMRNVQRADVQNTEFWSGSEAALRAQAVYARTVAPAAAAAGASAPAATLPAPVLGGSGVATAALPGAGAAPQGPVAPVPGTAAAPATGGAGLAWVAPAAAKVGETFTVAVRARTDEPLTSASLQLGFDAGAVELVEVREGGWMKQGGVPTRFRQRIDPDTGRLTLNVMRPATSGGVSGEGELALLTFRGRAARPQAQWQVHAVSSAGPDNHAVTLAVPAPLTVELQP